MAKEPIRPKHFASTNSAEPQDPQLYGLFFAALEDGLGIINRIVEQGSTSGSTGNGQSSHGEKMASRRCPSNLGLLRIMGWHFDRPEGQKKMLGPPRSPKGPRSGNFWRTVGSIIESVTIWALLQRT